MDEITSKTTRDEENYVYSLIEVWENERKGLFGNWSSKNLFRLDRLVLLAFCPSK